ncbi:hypothetical protein JCM10207_005779 [Rhodosporidiobolus poonsookiae]
MGLASKLAASQANPTAYTGYAPPPGPPPPAGAPPPAAPPRQPVSDPYKNVGLILSILEEGVRDQNLSYFYPAGSLKPIAERIASTGALRTIATKWNLPAEIAMDLSRLALFDVILYLDDSGSITLGSRMDELKMVTGHVAEAAGLFDADGIQVRWMNSKKEGNGFTTEAQAIELISRIKFNRGTPLGTSLREKVLEPLVYKPIKKGKLKKPLLIVCVTDGAPTFEPRDTIVKVIKESKAILSKTPFTADAVSYSMAQIGDDMEAREFLEFCDEHPEIGSLIDTTSSFEHEQDNMAKASPPVQLSREMWLAKLLLGSIHSAYDASDEK